MDELLRKKSDRTDPRMKFNRIRIAEMLAIYQERTGRKLTMASLGELMMPDKNSQQKYKERVMVFYNTGRRNCPIEMLLKLSSFFNCSVDALIDSDTKVINKHERKRRRKKIEVDNQDGRLSTGWED